MTTGKNKQQFEKWLEKNFNNHYGDFNSLDFRFQIGVYLAYYDSLGIYINVISDFEHICLETFNYEIIFKNHVNEIECNQGIKTRNEAYKEAFKKADEIINKEL